jgi:hypothetical protein
MAAVFLSKCLVPAYLIITCRTNICKYIVGSPCRTQWSQSKLRCFECDKEIYVKNVYFLRRKDFMTVYIHTAVLWNITTCSLIQRCRRFGGTNHLHLQGITLMTDRTGPAVTCRQSESRDISETGQDISSVLSVILIT